MTLPEARRSARIRSQCGVILHVVRTNEDTPAYPWLEFHIATPAALSCYEYQSCEHPEWEGSRARGFCSEFRDCLIATLPGYEDASWGFDEDEVPA